MATKYLICLTITLTLAIKGFSTPTKSLKQLVDLDDNQLLEVIKEMNTKESEEGKTSEQIIEETVKSYGGKSFKKPKTKKKKKSRKNKKKKEEKSGVLNMFADLITTGRKKIKKHVKKIGLHHINKKIEENLENLHQLDKQIEDHAKSLGLHKVHKKIKHHVKKTIMNVKKKGNGKGLIEKGMDTVMGILDFFSEEEKPKKHEKKIKKKKRKKKKRKKRKIKKIKKIKKKEKKTDNIPQTNVQPHSSSGDKDSISLEPSDIFNFVKDLTGVAIPGGGNNIYFELLPQLFPEFSNLRNATNLKHFIHGIAIGSDAFLDNEECYRKLDKLSGAFSALPMIAKPLYKPAIKVVKNSPQFQMIKDLNITGEAKDLPKKRKKRKGSLKKRKRTKRLKIRKKNKRVRSGWKFGDIVKNLDSLVKLDRVTKKIFDESDFKDKCILTYNAKRYQFYILKILLFPDVLFGDKSNEVFQIGFMMSMELEDFHKGQYFQAGNILSRLLKDIGKIEVTVPDEKLENIDFAKCIELLKSNRNVWNGEEDEEKKLEIHERWIEVLKRVRNKCVNNEYLS